MGAVIPEWWPEKVDAGIVTYRPGGTCGPRTQRDYQLVAIIKGSVRLTLDGAVYDFGPGQVILLMPGGREFFQFAEDEETTHTWVASRSAKVPPILSLSSHAWRAHPPWTHLSPELGGWMDAAIDHFYKSSPTSESLAKASAFAALELFCHQAGLAGRPAASVPEPVAKVLVFIQAHLDHPLSLADLARVAMVSQEHLCRLFRDACSTTPMAYLWDQRTEYGRTLLTSTGLSVAEVAERSGFGSVHHFCRRIKERTGLSPSQYRKRWWNP